MSRMTGPKRWAMAWEMREGACECCGGGAYVLIGAEHPIGHVGKRVRCDRCRKHCPPGTACAQFAEIGKLRVD